MYTLFVTQEAKDRAEGTFEIHGSRFLEYTSEGISLQLRSLSNEGVGCLKSWPCLLMQEGHGAEPVHLRQVREVVVAGSSVRIAVGPVLGGPGIVNDGLWKIRLELDIEQFEFGRTHLAIKDRDLFSVLEAHGHQIESPVRSLFKNLSLPFPARSELIGARDVIAKWGHSDIDDFLLEAGMDALNAGREAGSRRDRANTIVKFAIENPAAITAENSLFSALVVKRTRAVRADEGAPPESTPSTELAGSAKVREESESSGRTPNRVFLVHGRNEVARDAVMTFLSGIGLEGIVLHEQPNMGRHLLTKFIEEAELVTFAVVLMTDDDIGSVKGEALAPRARQNVILELGYFLARLGQAKVCALITPGLETPSDFDGIVYIPLDDQDAWKSQLERELRAADMPVREPSKPDFSGLPKAVQDPDIQAAIRQHFLKTFGRAPTKQELYDHLNGLQIERHLFTPTLEEIDAMISEWNREES